MLSLDDYVSGCGRRASFSRLICSLSRSMLSAASWDWRWRFSSAGASSICFGLDCGVAVPTAEGRPDAGGTSSDRRGTGATCGCREAELVLGGTGSCGDVCSTLPGGTTGGECSGRSAGDGVGITSMGRAARSAPEVLSRAGRRCTGRATSGWWLALGNRPLGPWRPRGGSRQTSRRRPGDLGAFGSRGSTGIAAAPAAVRPSRRHTSSLQTRL